MGKLPDYDAFDRVQIVGMRRMGHSISESVKQLGFSRSTVSRVYQEYMDGGQKLVIGKTAKYNQSCQCVLRDGLGSSNAGSKAKH
ncbi:hypothetical protein TNCV_1945271 [Trichonephila clavipes]|nr:hypothetical protein TNCV_1945271 [Trichonephila clavipes]